MFFIFLSQHQLCQLPIKQTILVRFGILFTTLVCPCELREYPFASQEFYPHGGPNYLPLKGTIDIFVLKLCFFFFGSNGYFGVWCRCAPHLMRAFGFGVLVFLKKARGLTDISGAFFSFYETIYLYRKLLKSAPFVMIAKYINKISSVVLVVVDVP